MSDTPPPSRPFQGMPGVLAGALHALQDSGVDALPQAPVEPPMPSLQRGGLGGSQRPLSETALAVADGIMTAAGLVRAASPPPTEVFAPPVPSVESTPAPPVLPSPSGSIAASSRSDASMTIPESSMVLVIADGSAVELREGDEVVIGRRPGEGGIVVDNAEISRRHLAVAMRLGSLEARDLGSTNGTDIVRGSVVHRIDSAPTRLHPGDVLVVSGDVVLCSVASAGGGIR